MIDYHPILPARFGYDTNFTKLLGGVERNSSGINIFLDLISPGQKFAIAGHIVSARTSQMIWSIEVPDDVEFVDNQAGFSIYHLNLFHYNDEYYHHQHHHHHHYRCPTFIIF